MSSTVRSLAVTRDQSFSFHQHVANVCRLCYPEIRSISSVRHLRTDDATKTLLCASVLSHLDYCNALLAGSPKHLIENLQKVQNHAARLVFRYSKCDNATPLLQSLQWLTVHKRIDSRFLLFVSKSLNQLIPRTFLISYMFTLPSTSFVLHLMMTFSVFLTFEQSRMVNAPSFIRDLPSGTSFHFLLHSQSLTIFKTKLKTHLFPK